MVDDVTEIFSEREKFGDATRNGREGIRMERRATASAAAWNDPRLFLFQLA
jgi:hypothetical protein